jgi:ATP-binding cassette subfamily C (CFTR/MRP) protein 1
VNSTRLYLETIRFKRSLQPQTESVIQDIIEKEFPKQTIIAVIHRLSYVDRFDRVAVLE